MVHKTKGIILRAVKYGETSLICTVFTELLGLQSYMVKGVRTSKTRSRKANQLFPGSILDLIVYDQPNRNLQLMKEHTPAVIYETLQEDVVKNGVAIFAIEVITQVLAACDPEPELFSFLEDFLLQLDHASPRDIANYPLYFIIQSARLSGYFIAGNYSGETSFADIHEGRFAAESSHYPPFISGSEASLMSELNQATSLEAIQTVKMNAEERRKMLQYFLTFLQLHVPHFRELRSVAILTAIFY